MVSKQNRESLFISLYHQVFPTVCTFLKKKGASMEDARDLFQEALIIYYEQIVLGKQIVRKQPKSYILGIVNHLWIKEIKRNNQLNIADERVRMDNNDPNFSQQKFKILNFLETAGRKCMDLLKAFYYDRMSMKEISDNFGFSGERSATVQKHKCLQKVRNAIKEKSLQYEDFIQA